MSKYREFAGETGWTLIRRASVGSVRSHEGQNTTVSVRVDGQTIFLFEQYEVVRDWVMGEPAR
jgi:hypothetical protein